MTGSRPITIAFKQLLETLDTDTIIKMKVVLLEKRKKDIRKALVSKGLTVYVNPSIVLINDHLRKQGVVIKRGSGHLASQLRKMK